jgi:hypothetical protein
MYLRIPEFRNRHLGPTVALHYVEVGPDGFVRRIVDTDADGVVVTSSPSSSDTYGVTDHPPLSMDSDWSECMISQADFEDMWRKAQKQNTKDQKS